MDGLAHHQLSTRFTLDVGSFFYGNVGSSDRLSFTLIGARLSKLHRMVPYTHYAKFPLVASEDFASLRGFGGLWRITLKFRAGGKLNIYSVDDLPLECDVATDLVPLVGEEGQS